MKKTGGLKAVVPDSRTDVGRRVLTDKKSAPPFPQFFLPSISV